MDKATAVSFSKTLAWMLRHAAVKRGLHVSDDGYVLWDDMKSMQEFTRLNGGQPFSNEQLLSVVQENDKQRFAAKYEDNKLYIRANQGHSNKVASQIQDDKLLTQLSIDDINKYPIVVHGTTRTAYETFIKAQGLKKMGRSHIHFAISDNFVESNSNQSGIRSSSDVLIYIDVQKAMLDGIVFFISDNKVILTTGVDGCLSPKYFTRVKYTK